MVSIYVILVKREYMQLSIYFLQKVSGADITMKDFSTLLCVRRYKNWAHKVVPWKYLIIWRPVLPVFSRAQSASSVLFILGTPFGGNWRSAATAAHNLILIEVDGKCQFVGDRIHLTKYVLDLYPENYKILLKEMNTNIHGLEDVSSPQNAVADSLQCQLEYL